MNNRKHADDTRRFGWSWLGSLAWLVLYMTQCSVLPMKTHFSLGNDRVCFFRCHHMSVFAFRHAPVCSLLLSCVLKSNAFRVKTLNNKLSNPSTTRHVFWKVRKFSLWQQRTIKSCCISRYISVPDLAQV